MGGTPGSTYGGPLQHGCPLRSVVKEEGAKTPSGSTRRQGPGGGGGRGAGRPCPLTCLACPVAPENLSPQDRFSLSVLGSSVLVLEVLAASDPSSHHTLSLLLCGGRREGRGRAPCGSRPRRWRPATLQAPHRPHRQGWPAAHLSSQNPCDPPGTREHGRPGESCCQATCHLPLSVLEAALGQFLISSWCR